MHACNLYIWYVRGLLLVQSWLPCAVLCACWRCHALIGSTGVISENQDKKNKNNQ